MLQRSLMLWRGGLLKIDMPRGHRAKEAPQAGSSDMDWSYLVRYSADKNITDVVRQVEKSPYEHALKTAQGNKNQAAKLLGISRGGSLPGCATSARMGVEMGHC